MKNKCKIKNCEKSIYAKRLILCRAHHARWLIHDDVQADKPIRKRRSIEEMNQRIVKKAPKKGYIKLSLIRKAIKEVSK